MLFAQTKVSSDAKPVFADAKPAVLSAGSLKPAKVTALNTLWDVYFDTLFTTLNETEELPAVCQVAVPSNWNKPYSDFKGEKTEYGYATYRLMLTDLIPRERYALYMKQTPSSACSLYADGELIFTAGKVGTSAENSRPSYKAVYAEFTASEGGYTEIVMQISNWDYRKGGLWSPVYLGKQNAIYRYYNNSAGITFFICAMLLFLSFVSLTIFILNTKKISALYFTLFLLSLTVRMIITSFNLPALLFDDFSYSALFKLEYAVLWVGPPSFLYFFFTMFPWLAKYNRLKHVYGILQAVLMLIGIVLPISLSNRLVPVYEVGTLIGMLACAAVLISAVLRREKRIILYILSVIIVGMAITYEIVYLTLFGALIFSPVPFSFWALAVIQFFALALEENLLFSDRVMLIHKLKKLNDAYIRFVPREFLNLLHKDNIIDVALGDYVQRELGIVFAQIYILAPDDKITLEDQYEVFNSFSMIVSLVMPRYKGFVSKFISKGIIALFPEGSKSAVDCCIEIQNRITKFNAIRRAAGRAPAAVAMGVHYGNMILGTIGEESRLDDTVISDAVNTASRIESVSQKVNYPVLISREAVEESGLSKSTDMALIPLGNIRVKGRVQLISLFSCLPLDRIRKHSVPQADSVEEIEDAEAVEELEELSDEI
ncbi:adenylate/guanylate cyclase domain-containing protein [Treponema sp. HNW]|uniref:adenylate/guanylate cyclase domain-containing protein n=1 Tax=Treponema sp. HNW TaxID=3116654 RepID=UPI003D0DC53A